MATAPPPPFTPRLPPKMAAAIERVVAAHRTLMHDHNAGRARVHRDVLEVLDATRRELVLLGDTLARHPPTAETLPALQAVTTAATELTAAYQQLLDGKAKGKAA